MKVWYFTHKGKVRQNNEDALLVGKEVIRREVMEKPTFREMEGKLFVVADGLGGHAKGEVASYEVLRVLSELEPFDEKSLHDALWKAKETLLDYVKREPSAFGLGTALAGVILGDKDIIVFNVGDCRVYLKERWRFCKGIKGSYSGGGPDHCGKDKRRGCPVSSTKAHFNFSHTWRLLGL
jgi:serine/threonine protein phosphatase PrpC